MDTIDELKKLQDIIENLDTILIKYFKNFGRQ